MNILDTIKQSSQGGIRQLAILADPDKCDPEGLKERALLAEESGVDYFFVGGSLLTRYNMASCIQNIRNHCKLPVVLFPGSIMQVEPTADAILLLSLISGRNPEMLIGNHVLAAPLLRQSKLEIIPTAYMLIESGHCTSALYMSNTIPIPGDKTDIASCTAMAGEMLGLQLVFMDAGSGADRPISPEMIRAVRQSIGCPLIAGGGIRSAAGALDMWKAGADMVVVGNAAETRPELIREIDQARRAMNKEG